jgi:hypothetical protein
MNQPEVLSLVEQLIPAYHAADFEQLIDSLTEGEPPSLKLLTKMELKRVMSTCTKSIDLRGRVNGECREYQLDGLTHWLDDVAINTYHKKIVRFGGYTEGVYEALINTHNNFRILHQNGKMKRTGDIEQDENFMSDIVNFGVDLQRQEKRMRLATEVELTLPTGQQINALSIDISNSGIKLKVPSAFSYHLGEVVQARFIKLAERCAIHQLANANNYRVLGVDLCPENPSIRWLRLLKLSENDYMDHAIRKLLKGTAKKALHDKQDRIIRVKAGGYEHVHLRNSANLPLFFSGTELKFTMLTDNNLPIWRYWHDERNQQNFGSLFNPSRIKSLIHDGVRSSSNVIYAFKHDYKQKDLFYSLMLPESNIQERKLFWHMGARKDSWKVFRIHVYELLDEEISRMAKADPNHTQEMLSITHMVLLVELSNKDTASDYLLTEKPNLPTSALNRFRHSRNITGSPNAIYFDARSRRKEPRFEFNTPVTLNFKNGSVRGTTLNFSNRGMSVKLAKPLEQRCGDIAEVHFLELQKYNAKINLSSLPYSAVRIEPNYQVMHFSIQESEDTNNSLKFLRSLIAHNKNKLVEKEEQLPNPNLLQSIHQSLLSRIACIPYFVERKDHSLRPRSVGVNFPLGRVGQLLHALGTRDKFSLDTLLKGRSNRLMASPMKARDNTTPVYHEVYLLVEKNGDHIVNIESKIFEDFDNAQSRIHFVKKAKMVGLFYAIRISASPVNKVMTELLRRELEEIAVDAIHHARSLENEFSGLIGYGEIVDITEEVLVRLELT